MQSAYKHTQYGRLTLIILLTTGILIIYVALETIAEGRIFPAVGMIFLYLLGAGMFYSFTTEISAGKLKFWFGIRLIQKSIDLREIQSTTEVRNPWYYFWGVKAIPGGWFYAIAPGPAVEIILTNGKIIHLGTNQSEKLKQAIDNARQEQGIEH